MKGELELVGRETLVLLLKCDGWVQNGTLIYKRFTDKKSWNDAMNTCKEASSGLGYLVEIQDMHESTFVTGFAKGLSDIWNGGCDQGTEGDWRWCGTGNNMTFTYWRKGEPNNGDGKEHCAHSSLWKEGRWNDYLCDYKNNFVCEMPINV